MNPWFRQGPVYVQLGSQITPVGVPAQYPEVVLPVNLATTVQSPVIEPVV